MWGQTTQISSSLSPKRDCGSKGVKANALQRALPDFLLPAATRFRRPLFARAYCYYYCYTLYFFLFFFFPEQGELLMHTGGVGRILYAFDNINKGRR